MFKLNGRNFKGHILKETEESIFISVPVIINECMESSTTLSIYKDRQAFRRALNCDEDLLSYVYNTYIVQSIEDQISIKREKVEIQIKSIFDS